MLTDGCDRPIPTRRNLQPRLPKLRPHLLNPAHPYVLVALTFYRPDEPVQLVGCINKIPTNLDWQPRYSFEQLVELMVEHELKELS